MKIIKIVTDHMHDTLDEANEYYRDYLIFKESYPEMATTALDMAKVHLNLYDKWHTIVVNLISKEKESNKNIPAEMLKLYDYEHENLIDEYTELKYKINNIK